MIEIRPIRKHEAETFLALLCRVFGLDIVRARHVFFREPLFDINRKWALFEDGQMRSILTTTPLEFGFGRAFGVAGVATDESHRGRGLGAQILERVLEHGRNTGEPSCMLFAHQEDLYKKLGFHTIDNVVRGPIITSEDPPTLKVLPFAKVRKTYDSWSAEKSSRLVRDERRWRYWKWIPRTCESAQGGYTCVEPHLCREAVVEPCLLEWPVMPGTDWLGLESLTDSLGVPLRARNRELFVMAHSMPEQPEMFMTDQF